MNWLKGLLAAVIGGSANAVTVIVVDPVAFNFGEQWKKTLTAALVAGVIAGAFYLKQSPLPGGSGGTDGGSGGPSGFTGVGRSLAFVLLALIPFCLTGCWGGKDASPTRKFVEQLDNNSISAREIQLSLKQLLDLSLIQAPTARSFGQKVETFRAANSEVIRFADSPEFKEVQPDGSVVITLTANAKLDLEKLSKTLKEAATAIVNDKTLFPNLPDSSRAIWAGFFANAEQTANLFDRLVKALKVKSGSTSLVIPRADWQLLQHAAGV